MAAKASELTPHFAQLVAMAPPQGEEKCSKWGLKRPRTDEEQAPRGGIPDPELLLLLLLPSH